MLDPVSAAIAANRGVLMAVANPTPLFLFSTARPGAPKARALIRYHKQLSAALAQNELSTFVWPALLFAYAEPRMSLSRAAEALDMPETAALRWIKSLHDRGMVLRHAECHPVFTITNAGRAAVENILRVLG